MTNSFVHHYPIPNLVDFDDELLVVEMELIAPPYLLDFGKAYIDQPPDFSAETMQYWREEVKELFGERASQVRKLLSALQSIGIFYLDAKPGNIMFGDEQQD
jgi:hypothetical protein